MNEHSINREDHNERSYNGENNMSNWTADNIPDLRERVAIVTGANSGLGYASALALARKNAHVVMACRNLDKAATARDDILQHVPDATLSIMALDLGDLASVRQFAQDFQRDYDRLDILMNNAGVMATPYRTTVDGFEMQFGVNHLGHFALTGLLIDVLLTTPASRVTSVTSSAQYMGDIHLDDLQMSQNYSRYGAYSQSKLANVLFAFELQRRLEAIGAQTLSNVAHPGLSNSNLQTTTAENSGKVWERVVYGIVMPLLAQDIDMGALPQLYAATSPQAEGGKHYAPRLFETRGYPTETRATKKAYDTELAQSLWQASERLTAIDYVALTP
jgi:protochlorophyllide reductase